MKRPDKQAPLQKLKGVTKTPLGISVLVSLAVLASVSGVAAAANGSKPGDLLYSVDIATEKVQLALTPGDSAKQTLHQHIAQERLLEIQQLFKQKNVDAPGIAIALADFEQNKQAAIGLSKNNNSAREVEHELDGAQSTIDSLFESQQIVLEKTRESLKQQAAVAEKTGDAVTAKRLRDQAAMLDTQLKTLEAKREASKQQQERLSEVLSKEHESSDDANSSGSTLEATQQAAKKQQEALQEAIKQEVEAQKEAQKQIDEHQREASKQEQEQQAEDQKNTQEQQQEDAKKQQEQDGQN